jgi:hypothetical protein
MTRHLNGWSAVGLTTPEHWADALVATRQWLDYSARNQVLLASYGVDGPVAGQETWRLVPSTTEGRPCAVRAGEHGWPVRVPITTGGSEPDPYLGGTRPSRSRTERFEWRPVFAIDQLARRPQPDSLVPLEVPERLLGQRSDDVYIEAVRKVARTTIRGRLPATADAHQLLAEAAVRLSRDAKSPPLDPVLGEQVAWLVADRVGHAPGELPSFDPEVLEPRDRWPRLQAVLDPARKLTAALGVVIGVDLTASPLPKMEIVDDRVVPAGRRRRLPAASFERLTIGAWQEVGPYSADEWAARGETGSGRGAYLRLNRSAYIVAVENGTEAAWRLEDIAERTGHDLLAAGDAPSLEQAKGDAVAAMAGRYPALDQQTLPTHTQRTPTEGPPSGLVAGEWEPAPGEGTSSAIQRRLSAQIVVYAIPGPRRPLATRRPQRARPHPPLLRPQPERRPERRRARRSPGPPRTRQPVTGGPRRHPRGLRRQRRLHPRRARRARQPLPPNRRHRPVAPPRRDRRDHRGDPPLGRIHTRHRRGRPPG